MDQWIRRFHHSKNAAKCEEDGGLPGALSQWDKLVLEEVVLVFGFFWDLSKIQGFSGSFP